VSVSDCESFSPLVKPSPRGFARTLLLGGLFAAAAMAMQNFKSPSHTAADSRHPMLLRFIDARPQAPSVYDEERRMSPAQLLNRWDGFVAEASQRFHVPKAWIRAVMRQESGGRTMLARDRPIVSSAGAIGLMQVLPATYNQMAQAHKLGSDPANARDNILAGTAYLRWLHQRYGYPRMFAAYNAGPGRVEQGGRLPAETRAYISGIAVTLRVAKGGDDMLNFTRPDGQTVKVDPARVAAIRAPLPGEYAPGVKAVLTVGRRRQAVREDVRVATAAIRATGGTI
jgi:hypothetical protein